MKRWIRLAANLYPRPWKERYGEEFEALLDDYNPNWREFTNVLGGALQMQMKLGAAYLKAIAVTATVGGAVAAAIVFASPRMYESSALVRLPVRDLDRVAQVAASGGNLKWLASDPKLDLYPDVPYRRSEEDALEEMRRNTQIAVVRTGSPSGAEELALKVTFAYPDRAKAEAVAARIAADAVGISKHADEDRARWQIQLWPNAARSAPAAEARLLAPANVAAQPRGPMLFRYAAGGLGAGLVAGVLTVFALKRTKRALAYATFAACGAGLALAVASQLPARYTSTAVLQLNPPVFPETKAGSDLAATMRRRFDEVKYQVLDPFLLRWTIQDPRFLLYTSETARKPIDEVVKTMLARDLSVQETPSARLGKAGPMTITVSFTYPDPQLAQIFTQEIQYY